MYRIIFYIIYFEITLFAEKKVGMIVTKSFDLFFKKKKILFKLYREE